MKSSWVITFLKAAPAHACSSVGAGAEQLLEGRGARMPRALNGAASLVRVLMRGGRVLMAVLAVVERGLGVLLGLVMPRPYRGDGLPPGGGERRPRGGRQPGNG